MSNHQEWEVTLVLSSLKIGRLTFTLRPLPAQLPSLDPLIRGDGWELHLLPWSELPPPKEGDPPEVSTGNHGVPCLLCHLLLRCWGWAFSCSVSQLLILSFLSYASEASSSKPHILSSMLYAVTGVQLVYVVPQGHPGHLALIHFPMMASAMAQQPSSTVLTIISTWASLPAQLTGPPKQNPTSFASSRGRPSLSNHHQKNKIASPEAKTTASVICSSRLSWNISAINKPVHVWGVGVAHLHLPLKSL